MDLLNSGLTKPRLGNASEHQMMIYHTTSSTHSHTSFFFPKNCLGMDLPILCVMPSVGLRARKSHYPLCSMIFVCCLFRLCDCCGRGDVVGRRSSLLSLQELIQLHYKYCVLLNGFVVVVWTVSRATFLFHAIHRGRSSHL